MAMTYRLSILEMVDSNDQQPNDTTMDTMEEITMKVVKRRGLMASVPFLGYGPARSLSLSITTFHT